MLFVLNYLYKIELTIRVNNYNNNNNYNMCNFNKPDLLILNISRLLIQGGLTNEQYGKIDYRLLHVFPTAYTKKWKECKDVGSDSKFTDIQNNNNDKAEGKRIKNKQNFIDITPSRDTGADRKFNNERLQEALTLNKAYYFYEAEFKCKDIITFKIYWCPIDIIKKVYEEKGNGKGRIYKVYKNLFEPYFGEITPTVWDINNQVQPVP